jgi:hypothetical protein
MLAIVLAAMLVAVPTASYAQAESCHGAGMMIGHDAAAATTPDLSAGLHHQHALAGKVGEHRDPAHHDGPKTCCGHACVFCSAVIAVDVVGVSRPLPNVSHVASADVPFQGLAVAPPIGPPRFQA